MQRFTRLFLLSLLCPLWFTDKSNHFPLVTTNNGSDLAHKVRKTELKLLHQCMRYHPGFVSNSTLDIMIALLNTDTSVKSGGLFQNNSEDLEEVKIWHVARNKRSQLGTSDNDKCCPTWVYFDVMQWTNNWMQIKNIKEGYVEWMNCHNIDISFFC